MKLHSKLADQTNRSASLVETECYCIGNGDHVSTQTSFIDEANIIAVPKLVCDEMSVKVKDTDNDIMDDAPRFAGMGLVSTPSSSISITDVANALADALQEYFKVGDNDADLKKILMQFTSAAARVDSGERRRVLPL